MSCPSRELIADLRVASGIVLLFISFSIVLWVIGEVAKGFRR